MSPKDEQRSTQILRAAETLFLRYGVRRTSVDDIAHEAGIAKGTVYLYFRSKEELFEALAKRLTVSFLTDAQTEMAAETTLAESLVVFLDGVIGRPFRLLEESPHAAEILESKKAAAPEVMEDYHAKVKEILSQVLGENGLKTDPSLAMFLQAAYGCLRTGKATSKFYRKQLRTHVKTLLAGI